MKDPILILEERPRAAAEVEAFLIAHGFPATSVASPDRALKAVRAGGVALVVFNLDLMAEDGMAAARCLRDESQVPLILISGQNDVHLRVMGLEMGADDFLTAPFEARELLARIRSVLRRHRAPASGPGGEPGGGRHIRIGQVELNMVEASARRASDGASLSLTSTEFALLKALVEAENDVVSRDDILRAIYGDRSQVTDRAIDAHMVRLRRKLAKAAPGRDLIMTVHGRGYRLAAEISVSAGAEAGPV
ncbi:MAG: response regulator transcription factor [Pseudomonadota bacterium]